MCSQSRPVIPKVCLQEGHRGREKARAVTDQGASTSQVQPCHTPASCSDPACSSTPVDSPLPLPRGPAPGPAPLVKVFCASPPVAWRTLFSFVIVLVLTGENEGQDAKGLRGEGGMGVREGALRSGGCGVR